MTRFVYTPEHLEFLQREYQRLTVGQLAKDFNVHFGLAKTEEQIRSCLRNHKIGCGNNKRKKPKSPRIMSADQYRWVKERYQELPLRKLLKAFNEEFDKQLTARQLRTFLKNHGITSGRTGYFQKGQRSWNAGTKGVMKANRTSFQPGHRGNEERPMFSERIDAKDGYVMIKVPEPDPNFGTPWRWLPKHKWLWQQAGREIPENHVLMFIDQDPQNCVIENLICIHRRILVRLNHSGYRETPPELRPALLKICMLEDTVKNRSANG